LEGQNARLGGRDPTPVKKLKGARFVVPDGEMVETQAIGRGRIVRIRC
jgi:hypothetical protein